MATISNLKDLSREDLMLEDTNVAKSLPLAAVSIINGEGKQRVENFRKRFNIV